MRKTKLALAMLAALAIMGCATTQVDVRTVEVPKPIPFIPVPPTVPSKPERGFLVDQLTEQDAKDPGKVAQAYKHDMIFLREILAIHQQILDQYRSASQDFDKTKKLIDELFAKMQAEVEKQNQEAAKKNDK